MAEPTLSLKRDDYRKAVGTEAGYGGDPTDWDDEQTYNVDRSIDAGLADFYYPTIDGGLYEWSFLKPYRSFPIASGSRWIDLPDDFNGFLDPVLKVIRTDHSHIAIRLGDSVRGLYSRRADATGPPSAAELALAPPNAEGSARYRLHVFPEADAAYTLQGHISIAAEALTERRPYIYGGPAHHFTVLAACLAAFESIIDGVVNGPHARRFQQRLMASVAQDRKMQPKNLGRNSDFSDLAAYGRLDRIGMGGYGITTIDDLSPE